MHPRFSEDKKKEIAAALEADPHATRTARRLGVSFAAVQRIAVREAIALTEGRKTMGRRHSPEKVAAVIEARRAHPEAAQREIAELAGISRSSVRRIEGDGRKARGGQPLAPERRAGVIEARRANPMALQREIAELAGVGMWSVRRIEGSVGRFRGGRPKRAGLRCEL
jgi:hypothetical protein